MRGKVVLVTWLQHLLWEYLGHLPYAARKRIRIVMDIIYCTISLLTKVVINIKNSQPVKYHSVETTKESPPYMWLFISQCRLFWNNSTLDTRNKGIGLNFSSGQTVLQSKYTDKKKPELWGLLFWCSFVKGRFPASTFTPVATSCRSALDWFKLIDLSWNN